MTEPQAHQPVFQTPDPEALKAAAKADPIHEREGAKETDIVHDVTDETDQLGQETAVADAHSQTTTANLGGH